MGKALEIFLFRGGDLGGSRFCRDRLGEGVCQCREGMPVTKRIAKSVLDSIYKTAEMKKEEIVNAGGINGLGLDLINPESADFRALQRMINEVSDNLVKRKPSAEKFRGLDARLRHCWFKSLEETPLSRLSREKISADH